MRQESSQTHFQTNTKTWGTNSLPASTEDSSLPTFPRHSPVDGRDSAYGRVGRGGHSLCQRQGSGPPQMRVAVPPERSGDCGGTSTWQETWVLPSACSTEVTRLQKRP